MSITQKLKTDETVSHPFLVFLITLFLGWMLKKFACKHQYPSRNLPPSPPKLPLLGNLHQLSRLIHRSLHSLGKKYGPIMLLHLGTKPAFVVQSADAAAEFIKNHDLVFSDKPYTAVSRLLLYDLKDVIITPYGDYLRKLKSICVLQLLSSKRVQSFKFIREEETDLLMEKIESFSSQSSSSTVDLSELFDVYANNVICRAAFGRRYSEGESGKRFLMLLRELLQLLGAPEIGAHVPWLSWLSRFNGFASRARRVSSELDDFLEKVVQEHINGGLESDGNVNGENFVDILLSASLDRDSIKAIILDMMAGGTDTTSATLEWAMTELIRNPRVMTELKKEVEETLKTRQEITEDDLSQMQYLKAVIKEALRLHPPGGILARVARDDVTVMGYKIEASTMVIVNIWAIARDPSSWDEPEEFRPERFLDSSIDFKGLDFKFIPFGYGRRGCPGIALSVANVELLLANLVHKFEWKLGEGRKFEDLDVMEEVGVATHRKNPLLLVPILSH